MSRELVPAGHTATGGVDRERVAMQMSAHIARPALNPPQEVRERRYSASLQELGTASRGNQSWVTEPKSACEAAIEEVHRQHSAKILAVLVRIFGPRNLELAEDVLQEAFRKALLAWEQRGIPDNPAAWVMTAAKHHAIDTIRAQRTERRFSADLASQLESDWTLTYTVDQEFEATKIEDDHLRMIFMCTNADIAPENRIPLILRTLSGFSIPAISRALLLPEATVKKRLVRTRQRLWGHAFEFPTPEKLPHVMDSVHTVLYLLFNEGFHSSEKARAMNLELCQEAVHLSSLLVREPRVVNRDTLGLLALMHFHLARAAARLDAGGSEVPIDRQDRTQWDHGAMSSASALLVLAERSAPGASGRFFIEAKIAEQHCIAPSFDQTDWDSIVRWYDELVTATESPLAELNRAIALGYRGDLRTAIECASELEANPTLGGSHLPAAALAHLCALAGDAAEARRHALRSRSLGGTAREQRSLVEQVERLLARA